jgi:hypothetical protein
LHVRCVQTMPTFKCEKTRCRRLNQTKRKTQRWIECVMQNKQIDDLTTNHSLAPLLEQKWMQVLDVKGMESSSKIDLKGVSWWKSIRNACRPRLPITIRLSKEGCSSLAAKRRPSCTTHKHDWSKCPPPQPKKHIPPK